MAKGLALNIGLNAVNPRSYEGWSGELDAVQGRTYNDMRDIGRSQNFTVQTLLTKRATRSAVLGGMQKAAKALKSGDLFFLTYSGHGGQLPDRNGDEPDAQDETWCLYDGELVDDELYTALGRFARGVRVLVLSDSCHSGSVTQEVFYSAHVRPALTGTPGRSDEPPRYRAMPRDVALRTYRAHRAIYDRLQKSVKSTPRSPSAPRSS